MKTVVSPIKIQGKKTRLIPFIAKIASTIRYGRYVEPFCGSCEVLLSLDPPKALVADNNRFIINFFNDVKDRKIDAQKIREFLEFHGLNLSRKGESYYYQMRKEFNEKPSSLLFLFVNRSCFNGLMRFNSKGQFNVPFCRKNDRFSKAYITKIVNQVDSISKVIWSHGDDWRFICQDFRKTLSEARENDFLYLDPPYINRNATYFDDWDKEKNDDLLSLVYRSSCPYILSNWFRNRFRENVDIIQFANLKGNVVELVDHVYQVGAKENNRNAVQECLIYRSVSSPFSSFSSSSSTFLR